MVRIVHMVCIVHMVLLVRMVRMVRMVCMVRMVRMVRMVQGATHRQTHRQLIASGLLAQFFKQDLGEFTAKQSKCLAMDNS